MAVFSGLPLQGQIPCRTDTINIGEVVISSRRKNAEPAGYKTISVDSSFLRYSSHNSLAEVLSRYSGVFVKSYGMGGTATPSFRGTGAGHTQLAWNDININQPMPGQSDLALIPAGFADDIRIYYGGASMPLNSGGIGGIINVETSPVWKKETVVSVSPGAASFGQYSGLVKVSTGSTKLQSVTKAFLQSCENDFPFLNTGISSEPVWQRRTNSQVHQKGFIQELYLRRARSVTSARVWYESADRNLPSSMLVQQPGLREAQFDESFRTMVDYDLSGGANNYSITGAMMTNRLNYTNSLAAVDSRNYSRTMTLKAAMERHMLHATTLRVTLNDELNYINSNNYAGITRRNSLSLTATAEINAIRRLGSQILVREILDARNFLVPDFSAGLKYKLVNAREYYLKANFSRNSKIPSMNELYWVPGGNPELRNEYAFIYELTGEINEKITGPLMLKYELSLFRNDIKDMIQWSPGEFSYWTAGNIKNVRSSGIESTLTLNYSSEMFGAGLAANYSLTKATTASSGTPNDASVGKQLIYVPMNQGNGSLLVNYRILYSSWNITMTGKRYLTSDNSSSLPGFILNNLSSGVRFKLKSNTVDFNFQVNNIFDVNYQTVAYYPLPGRSYALKLFIQLIK